LTTLLSIGSAAGAGGRLHTRNEIGQTIEALIRDAARE
jgi:hypothetical protein